MIGTNRRKLLVASAVLVTGALTLSAIPAQAFSVRNEVGVTSNSIKLGITLPMTGAASPGYNKIPGAMKAYFDYVNANGGVNGRKITLVVKDDAYTPTASVQATMASMCLVLVNLAILVYWAMKYFFLLLKNYRQIQNTLTTIL